MRIVIRFQPGQSARYNQCMPDDSPTQHTPEEPRCPSESTHGEDQTAIAPKMGIVFHDDDSTPSDFVLFLLETYLGYDEPDARTLCESVAANGQFQVAALPRASAEPLVQRIHRAVQAAGYPFKVTLSGSEPS